MPGRYFLPQLFISEPSAVGSSESSPVLVVHNHRNEPVPVKERHGILKVRSIDETLNKLSQEQFEADSMSERSNGSKAPVPHVATLMQQQPKSRMTGIRAAFERSNNRIPSNPGKAPCNPTDKNSGASDNQLARLNEELEKERALRKGFEERCAALEQQHERKQKDMDAKDDFWRKKMEETRQESGDSVREMRTFRNRARLGGAAPSNNNGLHRQLTELKRSISTSTRVETMVTTDSTFQQEMGSLAHEVQNWVVNNYRRAKISASADELSARLVPLVNERQLERLKPVWAGWKPENKIAVLQSTVAAMLMDVFDDQLLFGLPPQEEWTACLRKTARHMSEVLEPPQYNKWRATTLDTIRQTTIMSQAAESAADTMAEYVTSTLDALTGLPSSETKLSSLQPIVRRAITLAHLFRIQRARFSIELPAPLKPFDPSKMENTAFDRDAEGGHPIDCATFPAVLKLGDEHGENSQLRNVILKANVVCGET